MEGIEELADVEELMEILGLVEISVEDICE